MAETFKHQVEAINYIVKDDVNVLREQISRSLSEIDRLLGAGKQDENDYYTVRAADTIYQIPMKEILFFETCGTHRVTVYSENRSVEFRGDLSDIARQLPADYLRVHQSFLVNRAAVGEVDLKGNTLRLIDGSEIPVSRRGKKVLLWRGCLSI